MKKLIYLGPFLLIFVLLLSSCFVLDTDTSDKGDGDGDKNPPVTVPEGDYIWDFNTEVHIVKATEEFLNEEYSGIYGVVVTGIYTAVAFENENAKLVSDTNEPYAHEIVVGRADREISRVAYALLDERELKENDVAYLIYSDGNSLALAYTNAAENVAVNAMLDYFEDELAGEFLRPKKGIIKAETYSMTEIWQARDDEAAAKAWANLEAGILSMLKKNTDISDPGDYTSAMIAALKDIYSMYTDNLILWFAELYEPYICICDGECQKTRYCGGSGFYYSNSARDNEYTVRAGKKYMLLPDAETTAQVLGFIKRSGMLNLVDGNIKKIFPDGETDRIVRFIKALQDEETGYFYHPQWLSMLGTPDYWDSRQSRDMNYSISVLNSLGASPTYNTTTGVIGDGILYDGTDINASQTSMTMPLSESRIASVSKVVALKAVHPRLESERSFKEYLSGLNISGDSYYVGNELSSMAPQIVERDRELGTADNPRPLATILDKWLRDNQDPLTGHWHKKATSSVYYPTNGLLKIAALYNTLGLPFPNPLPAARTAFSVIVSEEPIAHVCDLYNTWFIISCVTQNLRNFSGDSLLAEAIIDEVRVEAIPAVIATGEKMKTHQKSDGSFSYFKNNSSQNSQNAPVAIPNTNEGDVNATVIFTYGILDYMFDALGFGSKVPMYGDLDRRTFLKAIQEKIDACEYRNCEN